MKKSWKIIVQLLLVTSLLMASCGKKQSTEDPNKSKKGEEKQKILDASGTIELPYPLCVKKDGKTVGGTLNIAEPSSTPFEGIFNSFLQETTADQDLCQPMWGVFMKSGPNNEIVDGGYCNVKFDKDAKTATYELNKKLTWSDGVPVTSDDLIFVYNCIANKDYTGVRYDSDYQNVVGIEEYHDGKANTISGLKKIDDKTLQVTFKEFYPGILWGAGLTYNVEPEHYLKDVPLKDMESSDKVRLKPLSCGPFVVSNIVPGESVEYVPNPHWFGEKPKLDKIVYKRANPDIIVEALKSGEFDVVDGLPADHYNEYKDLSNITLLSNVERTVDYIGFKLGKWDTKTGQVVMDPNMKMSDVKLREAIAYAANTKEVSTQFYNGLRIPANTLLDPGHSTFWDAKQEGYKYNPEKAKKILDEAGYVDKDGDGMREDPKGNKLKINFLARTGGDIAEPLAQFYIQCWRGVGLDVGLQNGRLIESNAFYDMIEADDPGIDIFMAGWGMGSNPDPSGLYGRKAQFNFERYASEANDKYLKAIASEDAFGKDGIDNDYLVKAYKDWQANMVKDVPAFPTDYRLHVTGINNRVNYWDLNTVSDWGWEKVGLLLDTPEKAK